MTIYDIDNVVLYLWYCCVIFYLLALNSIVLVKSFAAVFSLRLGKYFPRSCVLERHDWDNASWNQLLVN
jgi:hypothetical protein